MKHKNAVVSGVAIAVILISAAIFIPLNRHTYEQSAQYEGPAIEGLTNSLIAGAEKKDMFGDLTSPKYISVAEAGSFLQDEDEIVVARSALSVYGFPTLLMSWHHIVNEKIDGKPVAITYCMLADSAVALERKIGSQELSLGVRGNLLLGDAVLYDRETNSSFMQLTGDGFDGRFSGRRLPGAMPLEVMPWRTARTIPGIQILAPQKPIDFYRGFFDKNKDATFGMATVKMVKREIDSRNMPLYRGLGIVVAGKAAFYPLKTIEKLGMIEDTLGGWGLLVVSDNAMQTHRIFRRNVKDKVLNFKLVENGLEDVQTGSKWNSEGVAIEGTLQGTKLAQPEYTNVFWYNWAALFPDTKVPEADQ